MKNWKTFCIKSPIDNLIMPNKEVVKGLHLDKFLYFYNHIKMQIPKTRAAFMKHNKTILLKIVNSVTSIGI